MSINQRAKDMWVSDLVKRLEKLEEENRKLREKISEITMVADDEKQSIEHILELEEENKKLSEENGQLKEKIETLELRLDNKEKLNEEYRKQLDGYKM